MSAKSIVAGCLLGAALLAGLGKSRVHAGNQLAQIAIDYPLNGSVFPPDMAAPTFLWRDASANAATWQIDLSFADGSAGLQIAAKGEPMRVGEIDKRCISNTNKLPELTPEQAAAHTWKPDTETWARIRKQAGVGAVTVSISGLAAGAQTETVSRGAMQIRISADPVGAPIFYRDVPLMPSELEKGFIKPLATAAIPLIEWRMRNLADSQSHVVMTDLHTCANCHSFSGNGKTLGLDMDGPQNDKGLYAMVPVSPEDDHSHRGHDLLVVVPNEPGSPVRVGFMSQVSPDGRYVVTTIRPPGIEELALLLRGQLQGLPLPAGLLSHAGHSGLVRPRRQRSCSRCPAPTIRALCRPAPSGAPTASTWSLLARRPRSPIPPTARWPPTPTIRRGSDPVRPLPHPLQRRQGRQGRAD